MRKKIILFIIFFKCSFLLAAIIKIGKSEPIKSIKEGIQLASNGDTLLVQSDIYKEGNININKSITIIGDKFPILDGEFKYEILSFRADNIKLIGFKIINSGQDDLLNIGAIRLYNSQNSLIQYCIFQDNYFGIYLQRANNCHINNNIFISHRSKSQELSGNGIHGWLSSTILISNNYIEGFKDGIYLEKVSRSKIIRNFSYHNLRYGLHFMFSDDNTYQGNIFKKNSAGVAVMYSKYVQMNYNIFSDNWSDASYGLLLKDISFSSIKNNIFKKNTTAIYADGATKIDFLNNTFKDNGWGLKINSNGLENRIMFNNFFDNAFDVSTNGSLAMNLFKNNYWDKYAGYDLDRNNIGDIPYHPLSLYSVLAEQNPLIILLFKSFLVDLLDRSEKLIPSLTPLNFVDEQPYIKPIINNNKF